MKGPLAILAVAYALFFGWLVATLGDLPPRVASHFDLAGRANGWMNRDAYVVFTVGMALGLPLFMVGVTALTGRLGRGLNIPNRDYWLAPERRAATVAVVMHFVVVLAALVVLLVTALHLLIVRANHGGPAPRLSHEIWLVLAGFLTAIIAWIVKLQRRFARPL
jgi:hypothetical protein